MSSISHAGRQAQAIVQTDEDEVQHDRVHST